jgi:hypothetical protein
MTVLGTAQMAGTISQTVVQARFVQQIVHSQVLKEHNTQSKFSALETIRMLIFSINKWVNPICIWNWDSAQPPV